MAKKAAPRNNSKSKFIIQQPLLQRLLWILVMPSHELVFYYAPRSRSGAVLWMLEEAGIPYTLNILNFEKGEHKSASYLAINPMGKVPAIKHGETIITEAAAICCYLADAFPGAGLAPAIGDLSRGTYLRWLFYAPSCMEPAMIDRTFESEPRPAGTIGYGDFETVMTVVASAVSGGVYLLGDRFSAADVVLGSTLRYGMMFGIFPKRPEFSDYVARLEARPAHKAAHARDQQYAAAQSA